MRAIEGLFRYLGASRWEGLMMTAEIWFVLSALLLLLGMHPFVTYPLSLRLLPRPKARSTGSLVTEPAGDQSFL
jgi:hypothetical protein